MFITTMIAYRYISIAYFSLLHLLAIITLYYYLLNAKLSTLLLTVVWAQLSCLGITAGCHRLWAHKSYHAEYSLKLLLLFLQSSAVQMPVNSWCKVHRLHHRYTDTDLDPHNINRGFFFSHIGWLLIKPTPEVSVALSKVDVSDLSRDPLLIHQRRYFLWYAIVSGVIVPVTMAWLLGEKVMDAFLWLVVIRLVMVYNFTWSTNSVCHSYGTQFHTTKNEARDNPIVSFWSLGEGWHNYHHAYPGDYRGSEGYFLNLSFLFIQVMMKLGLARDGRSKKVQ